MVSNTRTIERNLPMFLVSKKMKWNGRKPYTLSEMPPKFQPAVHPPRALRGSARHVFLVNLSHHCHQCCKFIPPLANGVVTGGIVVEFADKARLLASFGWFWLTAQSQDMTQLVYDHTKL